MSEFVNVLIVGTWMIVVFSLFKLGEFVIVGTKSNQHRKMLTNLYVAGKIRQIAKKDDIDLDEELKEMLKTIKESRKYTLPLDVTIEEDLQEKIIKEAESKKK